MDRTDAQISTDIVMALATDRTTESYEIDVSVVDGMAYLYGTVDSYFEKGQAEDIAATVAGVTDVRNYLDVEYEGPLAYHPYLDDTYLYDYDWYDYAPVYTYEDDAEHHLEATNDLSGNHDRNVGRHRNRGHYL
ncbi:MAG: BON domain-containing protein [Planctomycetes bacterium]|nr:BON domain-containing protein [Planctomycetota bacterium]